MRDIDKFRGCLIGGAAGDALGYAVEFLREEQIFSKYGENGITEYSLKNGKAEISDDTQMTLFTANGLLLGTTRGMTRGIMGTYESYIQIMYKCWYRTQTESYPINEDYLYSWLLNIPELFSRRAPGMTCLSAIEHGAEGSTHEPINNSKGCGGVMRVAPVPLYAIVDNRMSVTDAALLAGDAAEITHQHPLGFIPAALVSHIIYRLALDEEPTKPAMESYIREGMKAMELLYPQYPADVRCMGELCEEAITLANSSSPDLENIEAIGEGWTGEEALAIALYCCLRHFDSFEDAIIASVNHGGDSDSTGAVTGNVLGAALGYNAIPQFYKDDLEMHNLILHMADDLYRGEVTKM